MEVTSDFSDSCKNLKKFHEENKYCDVNIQIADKTFPCHRNILASVSTHFENVFSVNLEKGKVQNIKLDCDAKAFAEILNYIYGGKLSVSSENVYRLLTTSILFGLTSVKNLCLVFLQHSNVSLKNIFEICTLAESIKETSLVNKLVDDIAKNFIELRNDQGIGKLSPSVLERILISENLSCDSDIILEGINKWLKSNRDKTNESHSDMEIEKETANYEKLKLFVATRNNKNAGDFFYVKEFAYNESKWKCIRTIDNCKFCKTIKLRNEKYCLMNGLFNKRNYELYEENFFYYHNGEKWKTIKPPPALTKEYQLVAGKELIYLYVKEDVVVTQYSPYSRLDFSRKTENYRIFSYIPMLDEWFSVPNSQYFGAEHCVTVMNDLLYVCGGPMNNECPLAPLVSSSQFYDHRENRWHKLPEMKMEHVNGDAINFKDKIFVSGGYRVEAFDPVIGKWKSKRATHYEKPDNLFASKGDFMYCFSNDVRTPFESYDPIVNNWTIGLKLNTELLGDQVQNSTIIDAFFF